MVDNVHCVDPKYLKPLSLIMAEGMSAAEALKCGYIWDSEVHDQVRYLPLVIDKDYISMQRKLKKLSGKGHDIENEELEAEIQVTPESNSVNPEENLDLENDAKKKMLNYLIAEITKKKDVYTRDVMTILPDLRTVQQNHHLMAVYVENCIGEELVQHSGFGIPDGTSHNKVGEMSALVLKVNVKIRAMKAQRIRKGDRTHASKIDCCIRK